MTVTTLSNGVRVANFSSPHPFTFVDGTVLPAVPPEVCEQLSLERQEEATQWPGLPGVMAVRPVFGLTDAVRDRLDELHSFDDVDVVIVPFPVLDALRQLGLAELCYPKAATCLLADRVTKICHIDRFCR